MTGRRTLRAHDAFAAAMNLAYVITDWDVQADPTGTGPKLAIRDALGGLTRAQTSGLVGQLLVVIRQFAAGLPSDQRVDVFAQLERLREEVP